MSSKNKSKTIAVIVAEYLEKNGFDGLFNGFCDCACELSDLFPCGEPDIHECRAGYKRPCNCGEHDFHIGIDNDNKIQIKNIDDDHLKTVKQVITDWWNDVCRKYWREYFADPDDRRQVLDELADMIVKKIRNKP